VPREFEVNHPVRSPHEDRQPGAAASRAAPKRRADERRNMGLALVACGFGHPQWVT